MRIAPTAPTCPVLPPVPLLALVAAAFGAMVSAQDRPVAFPHAATTGLMGNWAPLGEICSPYGSNVADARTHILIPAEWLPPRTSLVWALEHRPTSLTSSTYPCPPTGGTVQTVQYALLEITLAHRARGLGPLSTVFAANLPAPPPPPVLSAQTITIAWALGPAWNTIWFTQPFAYDGSSDLVVEIRKVVTPTGQNVGTLRNLDPVNPSLPRQVYASGVSGSGAHNATTGTYGNPLGWRLRFDNAPEPTLESSSTLVSNVHYLTGTNMQFRIYATPGDLFVLAASFGFLPASIVVPPFQGGIWLLPPITILDANLIAPAPTFTYHQVNFQIPPDPALAGLRVTGQSAVLSLATVQWDMTNAVDFVIR